MDSGKTMHVGTPPHHRLTGDGYDRLRIAIGVGMLCAILLARLADALIV
jgi:hypothetical protein